MFVPFPHSEVPIHPYGKGIVFSISLGAGGTNGFAVRIQNDSKFHQYQLLFLRCFIIFCFSCVVDFSCYLWYFAVLPSLFILTAKPLVPPAPGELSRTDFLLLHGFLRCSYGFRWLLSQNISHMEPSPHPTDDMWRPEMVEQHIASSGWAVHDLHRRGLVYTYIHTYIHIYIWVTDCIWY